MPTPYLRRVVRQSKPLTLPRLRVMPVGGDIIGAGAGAAKGQEDLQRNLDEYTRTLQEWSRDILPAEAGPGYDVDTGSSAAVGAEAVVLTILSQLFATGRAYEITWGQLVTSPTAGADAVLRVRRTNATGTIYGIGGRTTITTANGGYNANGRTYVGREPNAPNLITNVVLTLQGIGGNAVHVGSADQRRYLRIKDIGRYEDNLDVKPIRDF